MKRLVMAAEARPGMRHGALCVAMAVLFGCRHERSVPIRSDPAVVASQSPDAHRTDAAGDPVPTFTWVTEVQANEALHSFIGGALLVDSETKVWRFRSVRPDGSFWSARTVNELPGSELTFVEGDEQRLWLDRTTYGASGTTYAALQVSASGTKTVRHSWYYAVSLLDSGDVFALTTTAIPYYFCEPGPQAFERLAGTKEPPPIPPELCVYSVDVLPNGDVHAMAAQRTVTALAAFVVSRGSSRTMQLPASETAGGPQVVRGAPWFVAQGMGKFYVEGPVGSADEGRVVIIPGPDTMHAAAVDARGYLWIVESRAGAKLQRGRLDLSKKEIADAVQVHLPAQPRCPAIQDIVAVKAAHDDRLWVLAECGGGRRGLFVARV